MADKSDQSKPSKRPSRSVKDLRPSPVSPAGAGKVKGGTALPPEKRKQIARDT